MFRRRHSSTVLIYAAITSAAFFVASSREQHEQAVHTDTTAVQTSSYFSLSTNRTFATSENPRFWLDHRNIDTLDFRVYHIDDPQGFFTQLNDPHQLGEDERERVGNNLPRNRSLLEQIRAVKVWAYSGIRNYLQEHLNQSTRRIFNEKFRAGDFSKRVPLNVADYPRIPLLNSNQLVTSWREQLPHLEGTADLNVTREYLRLKVEPDGYNRKWSTTPLTGEIQSGDLIVVKLHVAGKAARHLMLEDPIPSGAEQIEAVGNLNLRYGESSWTDWYSAREFRDRRTVFFLDRFDGDATFQYAVRVQIPGEFVIPPARAELMYRPATHANTSSQQFVFLERH